jgi:hypothetical protein
MQWQLAIHTKLNLDEGSPKVITDHTDILFSASFLDWLKDSNISFGMANTTAELIAECSNSSNSLVLTTKSDVPAFISNKRKHIQFHYTDIPLNGNAHKAFKTIETAELISLLEVVFAFNQHQVVSEADITSLLLKADDLKADNRLEELRREIEHHIEIPPSIDSILKVSKSLGELIYLSYQYRKPANNALQAAIDNWSFDFFSGSGMERALIASTPKNPKTVDKILANLKSETLPKVALICFDCMGWAEWFLLKDHLKDAGFEFKEEGLMAMLPSVTAISRSAIFQGNRDVYHLKSPGRSTESKGLNSFFSDSHPKYFTESDEISADSLLGYNVVSLLYTFMDELCHSTHFPPQDETKAPYFDAVSAYLNKSTVKQDLKVLTENDYAIFICSDHGSIVAKGNGQRLEKYLIDNFAKRAVIVSATTEGLIDHQKVNIPFESDKLLAIPEGRTMFAYKSQIEVNHGGITVEEMVVPYIRVKK